MPTHDTVDVVPKSTVQAFSSTQVWQWYGTCSTSHFGLCPLSDIKNKLNTMCQRQAKRWRNTCSIGAADTAIP